MEVGGGGKKLYNTKDHTTDPIKDYSKDHREYRKLFFTEKEIGLFYDNLRRYILDI